MQIDCLTVGPIQANCYLARKDKTHPETLIIDPGAQPEQLLSLIRQKKLKPAAILLTHGHADHISAASELSKTLEIPVVIHTNDLPWAFEQNNTIDNLYPPPGAPYSTISLNSEREKRHDAGFNYEAILTPGHTGGSVCYYFPEESTMFSGDTVFAGSVGRTDLPGSDPKLMTKSVETVASLPENTLIYPGHGPQTTLAAEKKNNFFFQRIQ